jgi:hypothetical protein
MQLLRMETVDRPRLEHDVLATHQVLVAVEDAVELLAVLQNHDNVEFAT